MSDELVASGQALKGLKVIVVDDDADILYLAKLFLEMAGCVVHDFLEPEEAEAMLKTQRFDLLLTDFRMPGTMSGLELAQFARAVYPDIKVLIATGMDSDFCREIEEEGFIVLEKPYNAERLVQVIQAVLAE